MGVFYCVLVITKELPTVAFEKADMCTLVGVVAQRGEERERGEKNTSFPQSICQYLAKGKRARCWDVTIHSLLNQSCYFFNPSLSDREEARGSECTERKTERWKSETGG